MEMAGPPPMMEIKLIRKINFQWWKSADPLPPKMDFSHHFLFEGTPKRQCYVEQCILWYTVRTRNRQSLDITRSQVARATAPTRPSMAVVIHWGPVPKWAHEGRMAGGGRCHVVASGGRRLVGCVLVGDRVSSLIKYRPPLFFSFFFYFTKSSNIFLKFS